MRNYSENHGQVILHHRLGIDRISLEKDGLQGWKLRYFFDFVVAVPDHVVVDIERVKFLQRFHVIQALNKVVGEPELLEGAGTVFKSHNSLDLIV